MRIVFQLIENYLTQQIPSILVSTDTHKFVINVPSSFQRFTKHHKIKLPSSAIFLFTKTSSRTIAGLSGLLLTLFDTPSISGTKIYCDDKLYSFLEGMRFTMGYKILAYSYCNWKGQCRKALNKNNQIINLTVKEDYINILSNPNHYLTEKNYPPEIINDASKFYNPETMIYQDEEIKFMPFHIHTNGQLITNYIFYLKDQKGKILPNKVKELKIPANLINTLLKDGILQLEDGSFVKAQQIQQPNTPGPNFLILHYNCIQAIQDILQNQTFRKYSENKQYFTHSIVHIAETADIIESKQFKILLRAFSKETEHLIYNREYKNKLDNFGLLLAPHEHINFVSEISKTFPNCMPNINQIQQQFWLTHFKNFKNLEDIFYNYKMHAYKRCYEMILAPIKNSGYKSLAQDKFNIESKRKPYQFQYNLPEVIKNDCPWDFSTFNPRVIFLGTGSMKPSKYRNVSGILVELNESNSMLFDCGEGTLYQLYNHYGGDNLQTHLLSIRIIFITHIHCDHNLGILDLIAQRNRLLLKYNRNDKLFLIIPANVIPWFHTYCQSIENLQQGCQVIFIQTLTKEVIQTSSGNTMSKDHAIFQKLRSCKSQMVDQKEEKQEQPSKQNQQKMEQFTKQQKNKKKEEDEQSELEPYEHPKLNQLLEHYLSKQQEVMSEFQEYLKSMEIIQFLPTPVLHCPQSYGIIMEHKSKIKISYSGDTKPSQSFAKAALNSTLMIHEATFGDDLAYNAEAHYHSTVGQAITVGMHSKSWKTALTHFSQRYKSAKDIIDPSMYKKDKAMEAYAREHTIVCFDHLFMKLSDTPMMPYYSRAISSVIPKDSNQ